MEPFFSIPVCCGTEVFAGASTLTSGFLGMWESLGVNVSGYLKNPLVLSKEYSSVRMKSIGEVQTVGSGVIAP